MDTEIVVPERFLFELPEPVHYIYSPHHLGEAKSTYLGPIAVQITNTSTISCWIRHENHHGHISFTREPIDIPPASASEP
ncbi:hypothetical protein AB4K20DRAFT_1912246 [Rhizopus microsporus]